MKNYNSNIKKTMTELTMKTVPAILLALWIDTHTLFAALLALLLIDNAAALRKNYLNTHKNGGNEKWFDYRKMMKTVDKFVSYGIALIVAWLVIKIVNYDFDLVRYITAYLALYEAISIFNHLAEITGNNVFISISKWIKDKMKFNFKRNKNGNNNDK